ncbi:MAG: electron-transfer flavoprotein:ubiquinone oxidoreductase [Gemmatimonadota bacterium]
MPKILPIRHQRELPLDHLILHQSPGAEAIEMDVVFVGAGPAGLAGAIELAQLVQRDKEAGGSIGEVNIGVLEKAGSLGEHNLSGAVVNPRAFRTLFPNLKDEEFPFRQPVTGESVYFLTGAKAMATPVPPTMKNHGNYIGSICEIVRWLGEKAEALGVNIFPGFPVDSLLVEDDRVIGVRTTPSGLERNGSPGPNYAEPTDLSARITVLSEGTRGPLGQAYRQWKGITSPNPQLFALGVKEVWQTKRPLDRIIHTLGYPLPTDAFGGSFVYPLSSNLLALGLVVGTDYHNSNLDVHVLLQKMKSHPLFREYLEGGEMVEWGAKTIPEGGYYSLPKRFSGAGLLMVGDTVGFVDVPSLKGIHYAMESGMLAARAAFDALKRGDLSAESLSQYDRAVNESYVVSDMKKTRNMRLAFKSGFVAGGFKAGLMTVTGGRLLGGRIDAKEDAAEEKVVLPAELFVPDNTLTFSKVDAVFKSGNETRDSIPVHLLIGRDISGEVAEFYSHMCPAGVYERVGDELRVNAPNCVDCKATDVLGPRWTPREGGSGPKYRSM